VHGGGSRVRLEHDAGKKERLTGRSHLSTKEGEMAAVRENAGARRRRVGAGLLLTIGPRGWLCWAAEQRCWGCGREEEEWAVGEKQAG